MLSRLIFRLDIIKLLVLRLKSNIIYIDSFSMEKSPGIDRIRVQDLRDIKKAMQCLPRLYPNEFKKN